MTDLDDLIRRMADELDNFNHPFPHALATEARAALAQQEGEGPTDDSAKEWQWYTYCPEEGIELYPNRQQAQSAAQSIMGSYEVAAHSDGWHEDMELVSWGMLVPVEHAQVVARGPADSGSEFDEWVRYELKAVARFGRPAPLPADDGPAVPEGREPASVDQQATAGGVGELVEALRLICYDVSFCDAKIITRAADLLTRLALQPVPVSERLPGAD